MPEPNTESPRVTIPLSTIIADLKKRPQRLMFSETAWNSLEGIIEPVSDFCPHLVLFEFPLNEEPVRKVDFSFALSRLDSTQEVILNKDFGKNEAWKQARNFILAWFRSSQLPEDIRMLGFECDAKSDSFTPVVPSPWVATRKECWNVHAQALQQILGPVMVPDDEIAYLRQFIDALPDDARVAFIGLVLGRPIKEVRMEICFTSLPTGLKILEMLDSNMPPVVLETVRQQVNYQFLNNPQCIFSIQVGSAPRPIFTGFEINLHNLSDQPQKLTDLLTGLSFHAPLNPHLAQRLALWHFENEEIRQYVSHLKLAYKPESGLYAKAYLGLFNKAFFAKFEQPPQQQSQ